MKVGIVDADLLGREKHRFPNLVCEKLSGYWKDQGAEVELIMDNEYRWLLYDLPTPGTIDLHQFSRIYIAKVFTDTWVPDYLISLAATGGSGKINNTEIYVGGTGFYFDKAPNLPDEIEHHMPDYHLYDDLIATEIERGIILLVPITISHQHGGFYEEEFSNACYSYRSIDLYALHN